jgi:hypothetical protein
MHYWHLDITPHYRLLSTHYRRLPLLSKRAPQMRHNLGRDFSRLTRSSAPQDPRAPWWVNWLLQLAVGGTTIWAVAASLDWAWQQITGNHLGTVCWIIGLMPFGWLMPIGMIVTLIGVILVLVGTARTAGVIWLILGTLLYSAPEFLAALGIGQACGGPAL